MNSFIDEDLGNVLIKKHGRAKKVLARRMHSHVQLTVPSKMPKSEILSIFEKLKPKILALPVQKIIKIGEHSDLKSLTFSLSITRNPISETKISMSLNKEILKINVPPHFNINDDNIQLIIKDMLIHALRHEAKRILPARIEAYAKKWNIKVREIKVNKSKSRWGSCTGRKNINMSLFIMMLPERLIDYVIVHELAHTFQLDHSKRFWDILEKMLGKNVAELDNEVTYWNTDYLTFLKS